MSPDNFLSSRGIRTETTEAYPGTPAEKVKWLQQLNATRIWNPDTNEFDYTTYHSPNVAPGAANNPNAFVTGTGVTENSLIRKYNSVIKIAKDLQSIYNVVDEINNIRNVMGIREFVPFPDFDLIAEGSSPLAVFAKFINSERMWVAETGRGSFFGSPLPWFDTKQAWEDLNNYKP